MPGRHEEMAMVGKNARKSSPSLNTTLVGKHQIKLIRNSANVDLKTSQNWFVKL